MNFSVDFFMTTISLLQKFYLTSTEMKDDKNISGKKKVSQADIWATIMKELRISTHTPLAKVIELMLVIPSSTAEVGRFFKVLKEMKNKKRN